MTLGRHILMSSVMVMFLAAPALATTEKQTSNLEAPKKDNYQFDLDLSVPVPASNWIDSVTMTRIPRGSLYRNYSGPTRFVLKIARNQVRRFARDYYEHSENPHRLQMNINGGPVHQWWTREWFDSLPASKGGAPAAPFVHTYGREISWKLGPISVSNTFKLKIDYIAAFNLDADPEDPSTEVDPNRPPKANSIEIDVHPEGQSLDTTSVKFKVRPNVRVGMPHLDEGWWSFIRKISVRAELAIIVRGRPLLLGDAEVSYTPGKGFSLKFGIAIGIW